MARAERPLDEGDGRLVEFAVDLRRLRVTAGRPAYRELSRRAHYSATTLSDAAGGRRLPSLSVTLAYVAACGGDTAVWERRWHALAAELTDGSSGGTDDTTAPYVGLAMFQAEDAERFFGRERLVAELVDLVARQRFVVLVGPSGSGKSSLLRAGLVRQARTTDPVVVMTPGPHPLEECAAHLAALTDTVPSVVHTALRADPRCLHRTALQALATAPPDSELLVVVDQFEEVFTLCHDTGERAEFITALRTAAEAVNSRTRIVLGLRADFYAHCTHYPGLVKVLREAQVLVGPMSTEELRAAITRPALDAGCRVETALVSRIVADAAGQSAVLPLISHALLETWRRRRGTTLTLAGYDAAGGITHSIARTAETIHTALSPDEQHWAQQVFLRLVVLGEGTEDTRRRIDRAELDLTEPGRAAVLERLAQARLITLDQDTVEVTHEALIQCWPRLHGWLTEDRESLRVHRQLTEAASTWQALQRDPGALYRGIRLTQAEQWATTKGDGALSTGERDFLRASLTTQAHDHAVARRRSRRLRQLLALLSVLLVLTTAATGYALRAQQATTEQRNVAIVQKVLSQAASLRAKNPALALQLTLAAHRLVPLPEAHAALLNSFAAPYATRITEHTDDLAALAFAPKGQILVTTTIGGAVRIWDVSVPHHPRELADFAVPSRITHAAVSPDGRTLAVARLDEITELIDITEPGRARTVATLTSNIRSLDASTGVAFSADGRTLAVAGATAGFHGIVKFWDVSDRLRPRQLATRAGQYGTVDRVAFLPGSRVLATANTTTTDPASGSDLRLWDVTDPVNPREQAVVTGLSKVIQFSVSPDGCTMAVSHQDGTVTTWDVTDVGNPRKLTTVTTFTGVVNDLHFSPDGHTLATASSDRTVQLWDITDMSQPQAFVTRVGFTAAVEFVAFSPDSRTLVSGDGDRIVRLEDVSNYSFPSQANGGVHSVSFHPDGHTMATANSDGTVVLADITDLAHPRDRAFTASTTKAPIITATFSPDGDSIATTAEDGTLTRWHLAEDHRPTPTVIDRTAPRNAAVSMAFSPDGQILATGHPDGTITLWDTGRTPHRELSAIHGTPGAVTALVFQPNTRILAAISDNPSTMLWDLADPANPRGVATVHAPAGDIVSVAFSPDGHTMATGDTNHRLWLWHLTDTPRPTTELNSTSTILTMAFSPDGKTLAAGKADSTADLWDVTDPAHPQGPTVLTGPDGGRNGLGSIAFSPNNHVVTAAGTYRAPNPGIRLWEIDTNRVAARICELVWPAITPTEWHRYFPDIPYRAPCP